MLLLICFLQIKLTIMSIVDELTAARKHAGLTQGTLAARTGLNRMTVQRTESQEIDPRLSTVREMARALGMDVMLVPLHLRQEMEAFVQAGGRMLGQPAGTAAPLSVVDALAGTPGQVRPGRDRDRKRENRDDKGNGSGDDRDRDGDPARRGS